MKSEPLNLRVKPELKEKLRRAAEHEHRSITNMVEVAIMKMLEELKNGREIQ